MHLLDEAGAWPYPGLYREDEGPLRPLAELTLTRGYVTEAGVETVDLPPMHVLSVRRGEGQGVSGMISLQCTDALGLLGLWRAPEALTWKNRPIRWLLAELCARVGLRYADAGEASLGRELPQFTLQAGQAALDGALALLRLGGCVARVDADGALRAWPWPQTGAPQMTIGAHGEVRRGTYGQRAPDATGLRVSSGGAYAEGEAIPDAWALGLRLTEAIHDGRIGLSVGMAEAVRNRELALAGMGWRCDEALVPARMDLELWDVVELDCAATARVGAERARVVTGIVEKRDASRGVFEAEVEMGRM